MTFTFESTQYHWTAEPCVDDADALAVFLDPGNGREECIGYAEDMQQARQMVADELEKLYT